MINQKQKKMGQQVIPVGKKILIKQKKAKTKTASGLFLPEIAQKKEYKGLVMGIGKAVEEIKVGDVVQYTEHCLPTTMPHNGEDHLLIQEGDVFAILVDV
jgi:chaperonin GroES|tara:strand:- start:485 stop:784 length:300 start_codon:yes stop_codon:yes gene_type:complete